MSDAATPFDSHIVPLASDVEPGEFMFARDASDANLLYLVRVTSMDDTTMHVHTWGCTSKNVITSKYHPVGILTSNNLPMTRPCAKQVSRPWAWQIPLTAVDNLVIVHSVVVLPSGALDTSSHQRLKALPRSFSVRNFCHNV